MADKKTNKVQIPIDERETFVSLQKNFADSDLSVQEKLKVLYDLQEADNEIEKINQLRGELPAEVAALEDEIAGLKSKVAYMEDMIAQYNASIDNAKESIIQIDTDIDKYQAQLGNVSNSREYDSISKEVENQNLLRQIAEKNIGEAKMAIAEKKDGIESLNDRISIREEDLEAKKKELESIIESTATEQEKLQAKRDECAAKIDERTMSAYNRIRESVFNKLAVVPVYNENACGGCFSTITPQRLVDIASGTKLVICEHCGRILVSPDIKVKNQ
ncbi:MAG: C4-type zinc ribbon domain-containing protein [Bacteroidales bacterium]|nr:C4-type zinc ribbon domain-containing protein [Bacteroidales bacterium]